MDPSDPDDLTVVATFGGVLREGLPMGLASDVATHEEQIHLRIDGGNEPAAISLNREHFRDATQHEDGSLTLTGRAVELLITHMRR